MVDQSADREEHPYEKAERHERRGYGTEQSVSQGSQHGNPPSVERGDIYSLAVRRTQARILSIIRLE